MIPIAVSIFCTAFMVIMLLFGQRSDASYALFGLALLVFSLLTPAPSPRLPMSAYLKAWVDALFLPADDIRKAGMLLTIVWATNVVIWQIWPDDAVLQTVIDCSALFFLAHWRARAIATLTAVMIGVAFARYLFVGGDYPYQVAINLLFVIQCTIAYYQLFINFRTRTVVPGKSSIYMFRESHNGRRAA